MKFREAFVEMRAQVAARVQIHRVKSRQYFLKAERVVRKTLEIFSPLALIFNAREVSNQKIHHAVQIVRVRF